MLKSGKYLLVALCLSALVSVKGQRYTTANAHSHNDYEQHVPFYKAWENGFGSIEADVFLVDANLIVAHDSSELKSGRTLDSLYLVPLRRCIEKNGGFVYADKTRALQLMIDIKSEAGSTLDRLVEVLNGYTALINSSSLRIVISGNRPAASQFALYPSWIFFDGDFRINYSRLALERVQMFSDNFARYSSWDGTGNISAEDKKQLLRMISFSHRMGKKIRFWNAPDTPEAWRTFIGLEVDYINTDKIEGLARFLSSSP
ncbi:MAG: phosphatidylinositol-specific phospholipase C/glycerophosphodiester phosphodiesterase family protein [Chitinophagaceae bacterium]|nr:phosphatidylinositol-specific phospholipase C/glycerophosphodiester phosphodiesterase family protein [Chitinophagaceae bacterium]